MKTRFGALDSSRNLLRFVNMAAGVPLRTSAAGRYVVDAAEFERCSGLHPTTPTIPSIVRMTFSYMAAFAGQPLYPGAFFASSSSRERERCLFTAPKMFLACEDVMVGHVIDPGEAGDRDMVKKVHLDWAMPQLLSRKVFWSIRSTLETWFS